MRVLGVLVAAAATLALAACSAPEEASPTVGAPALSTPTPTLTPSPSPSATPSPEPSVAAGGAYLALGDSLAVGVGASAPDQTGYAARLYQRLTADGSAAGVTALRNLAISGETSSSMIRGGQLAAALETIAGADPQISVVTLDIGGNDLLRLLGTDACAANPQGSECLQLLALTLADFETNFRQIVGELMTALDEHAPDARLAVMTYFNPFSGTDAAHEAAAELALLGVDGLVDCEADDPQAHGMNDIIVCIGDELGAIGVDVHPAFVGLGLELTHIASDDIHANDRGYEVIADAFLAALSLPG